MSGKGSVKCAKCGISSKEDATLTFHRFPLPSMHGSLKAKVWATFCFPNDDWTSNESLEKLYKQHKMICGNHFDNASFTGSDRQRLNKFAIPIDAQHILAQLRDQTCNSPGEVFKTKCDHWWQISPIWTKALEWQAMADVKEFPEKSYKF